MYVYIIYIVFIFLCIYPYSFNFFILISNTFFLIYFLLNVSIVYLTCSCSG